MSRPTLFFLLAMVVLASCTVKEELTFNKDFSGTGVVSWNFDLYGDETDPDSVLAAQTASAEEFKKEAMTVPGISNVRYNIDLEDPMMWFYFDFKNLKALNDLYSLSAFDEAPFMRKTFAKKGSRKLTVIWPVHALTAEDREAWEGESDDMQAMYTHELILNLPREIKTNNLDTDRFTCNPENKSVKFEGNWGDFYTQAKPITWKVQMR